MSLELRPEEVAIAWLAPEASMEERSELTPRVRGLQVPEFVPTTAADRKSAERDDGLEKGRLAGTILADEEGDSGLEAKIELRKKRERSREGLAIQLHSRPHSHLGQERGGAHEQDGSGQCLCPSGASSTVGCSWTSVASACRSSLAWARWPAFIHRG